MATSKARRARRLADPEVGRRHAAHVAAAKAARLAIYAETDPDDDALLRAAAELGIELPEMSKPILINGLPMSRAERILFGGGA